MIMLIHSGNFQAELQSTLKEKFVEPSQYAVVLIECTFSKGKSNSMSGILKPKLNNEIFLVYSEYKFRCHKRE